MVYFLLMFKGTSFNDVAVFDLICCLQMLYDISFFVHVRETDDTGVRCIQCESNTYIIDSNSSVFGCQQCPVGAACNGQLLAGMVSGSIWVIEWSAGIYRLTSCPPGFELINEANGCPLSRCFLKE